MSSLMRRLRKRAPGGMLRAERQRRHKEALEFDAQRRVLFDKLREYANEVGDAMHPMEFLAFLRQQRRGYDRGKDGASRYMQLLDDIDALDEVEREWAEKR